MITAIATYFIFHKIFYTCIVIKFIVINLIPFLYFIL